MKKTTKKQCRHQHVVGQHLNINSPVVIQCVDCGKSPLSGKFTVNYTYSMLRVAFAALRVKP